MGLPHAAILSLDLILHYFGKPEWVFAYQKQFYSKEVDDFTHVVVGYRNGLTGHLDVSWSVEGFRLPETKIEVTGSEGRLEVSEDRFFIAKGKGQPEDDATELTTPELYKGVDFLVGDPEYCIQDKYFLQKAKTGSKCRPDFEEASNVNRVIEATQKSEQWGRWFGSMTTLDKFLIGDNPFNGVYHRSRELTRERAKSMTIEKIVDIIGTALDSGAGGLVFTVTPKMISVLKHMKETNWNRNLGLYPIFPDVYSLINES